jgi:hypothetical protein
VVGLYGNGLIFNVVVVVSAVIVNEAWRTIGSVKERGV